MTVLGAMGSLALLVRRWDVSVTSNRFLLVLNLVYVDV